MAVKLSEKDEIKVNEIVDILKNKNSFLITSHINIDGDGIGSEIALFIGLKKLRKNVEIINQDKLPKIFKFLPYSDKIKIFNEKIKEKNFDVGIIIDCGNIERVGELKDFILNLPFLINIDHHLTNSNFGHINWSNPIFSSTGEMIYFICKKLGQINKKQAICLYTSILYDTYCFTHHLSNFTFDIVKNLLTKGINPEKIAQRIFFEKSIKSVNLFKEALKTFKFYKKLSLCTMEISNKLLKKTRTQEEHTEGFVDFLISIKGVEVGILFKERANGVKVSMRSKGKVDVENIAKKFGGGGHREAAGCFFENKSLKEVEKIILKELQ